MKLLFDQNLSPGLVTSLADHYGFEKNRQKGSQKAKQPSAIVVGRVTAFVNGVSHEKS